MQFIHNQLPDLKKFLKLLNPGISPNRTVCNVPTTPLPCKALTMKITIFTGGFLSASEIREEGLSY